MISLFQVLEETRLYVSIKKIDKISTLKMAILMKIKLMEVMIKHYKRELDKMKTRKVLVEELDNLTKIDRKSEYYPNYLFIFLCFQQCFFNIVRQR